MGKILHLPDIEVKETDLKLLLAIKLFEEDLISLGKAAEVADLTEREFTDEILKRGISPVKFNNVDPNQDLNNA
jgi:predicted HTH domain antitoxin